MTGRLDYAVRAVLVLAAAEEDRLTRVQLSAAQDIPPKYLETILTDLRNGGIVVSHRGVDGGYELARPTDELTVADIARAVEGPLTLVQGRRPETLTYEGPGESLQELWIGLRAAMRRVLEGVTIADLLEGELPAEVRRLLDDPGAWSPR